MSKFGKDLIASLKQAAAHAKGRKVRGVRVTTHSRRSIRQGSENVFDDLGLPNPKQELLKARLTLQIYKIVKARGLTQAQAGEVFGIRQPHVSALMRNRAGNLSVGRLMEFLTALGQDVQITVKPNPQGAWRDSGGDERADGGAQ